MKRLLILICLSICFGLVRAQRFFYVENNPVTGDVVKDDLLRAAQFITRSPLSSDYVVKTNVNYQTKDNILTLEINLQDTATSQTIYQDKKTLAFGALHANPRIMFNVVIRAFIDKNIDQIIVSAKDNHFDQPPKWLRIRKDKT